MSRVHATLTRSFRAVPASVPLARRAVVDLVLTCGASTERLDAIKLAVSEAVTNVVQHAYSEQPGEIHVTAAVASGELWVLIADDGHGLERSSTRPGLGVGLALIAQATDDFTVGPRASSGVQVTMRFDLEPVELDHSRGSVASAVAPA